MLRFATSSRCDLTGFTQNEAGSEEEDGEDRPLSSPVPMNSTSLSAAFPFTPPVNKQANEDIRTSILEKIPRPPLATQICENYFRHAAWMCVRICINVNTVAHH